MRKCANISSCMRRPLVIYKFDTAQCWISLYMRKICFYFFYQCMWVTAYYNAREPANIGRKNYLPPLPTFTIHFSLHSIVQCSLSHILNVIWMRPVPLLHPFARCIPGIHLPWDASSIGRIVQGMKRSGTHRHATGTPTNPSPLLSATVIHT
jgi:hypothetical protein